MENERYVPTKKDYRNFLQFFGGQLVSVLGSNIVSFTIIWWITVTYLDPVYISLVYFFAVGIQVLMGPIGGVVADRVNRKKLIFTADTLIALVTLVYIPLFTFAPQIDSMVMLWSIISIVSLRAFIGSFQWPAVSAILPIMVPKDKLTRVNGIRQMSYGVINIIGPAIGAVVYKYLPMNLIITIDLSTYAIALIPLFLLQIPKIVKKKEEVKATKEESSFFADFKDGLKFLFSTKGLLALFLIATFINFFEQPLFVLRSLFINVHHGGTADDLALMIAIGQIGTFLAGFVVIFKKKFNKKTTILMIALYIQVIGYYVISLAPKGLFWVLCLGTFIMGITYPFTNSMLQTITQIIIPPDKLGRMSGILSAMCMGLTPIAMLVSGSLAEVIGFIPLFVGSITLGVISITLLWLLTKMRTMDKTVEELEQRELEMKEKEATLVKQQKDEHEIPVPVPSVSD